MSLPPTALPVMADENVNNTGDENASGSRDEMSSVTGNVYQQL